MVYALCVVDVVGSAGIGRTGVLITMETAMCQIEANEPVFPLNVVRQMREQRAMLIQTAVSCTVRLILMCFYLLASVCQCKLYNVQCS